MSAESQSSRTSERVAVSSTPSTRATFLVRVLDAQTKQPVSDAEVRAFKWTALSEAEIALWAASNDREVIGNARVRPVRTDALGEARVPRLEHGVWITARKDAAYGQHYLDDGNVASVTIDLVPDASTCVRVVDDAGLPQRDVRVWLADWPPDGGRFVPRCYRGTDAQGLARFAHLPLALREIGSSTSPASMVVAQVQMIGVPWPCSEPFAAPTPPDEPVLVRLPATGEIVVEVRDARGELLAERAFVSLRWGDGPTEQKVEHATGGRARFAHVALGKAFTASAERLPAATRRASVTGPTRTGESVTAVVAFAADDPVLVGRAVDHEGRPLAERRLMRRIDPIKGSYDCTTDANGRFRVLLPAELAGTTASAMTFLCHRVGQQFESMARIQQPIVLARGETALGDVVFTEPPLIVGAQLVESDGAPVRAASIVLRTIARLLYDSENDLLTRTLADGRHEVRGYPPAGELELVVYAHGYRKLAPIPFVRGANDLRIVLERGTSLSVEVLLDPRIEHGSGFLRRADAPEPDDYRRMRFARVQSGSISLSWIDLSPGTYDFSLIAAGDPDQIATRAGIVVGGAATHTTIDLRDVTRLFRIVVVDASDKVVTRQGAVRVRSTAGDGYAFSPLTAGAVEIHSAKAQLDAFVSVLGGKTTRVAAAPGETRVLVTPGLRVRVRCEGLPPSEHRSALWLENDEEPVPAEPWATGPSGQPFLPTPYASLGTRTGTSNEITFEIGQPGRYRVLVGEAKENAAKLLTIEPPSITVADRDGEQAFTVKAR